MQKNILVVGSGGREHAMLLWLSRGRSDLNVFVAPGNAGMCEHATLVDLKADDIDGLVAFARDNDIYLTVVGPEVPLVLGIVDRFEAEGLRIFGPDEEMAQAEGSKAWFKRFLVEIGVATAEAEIFSSFSSALAYVNEKGYRNIVIKADKLAAGKGVFLPSTHSEAVDVLRALMVRRELGGAGRVVVIEERLHGEELSVMGVTDGSTVYLFPTTRDYKRRNEGDEGPNTGGMGAHTIRVVPGLLQRLQELAEQVIHALGAKLGRPYKGFFYLGLMLVDDEIYVLEMNIRLGDPEAQPISRSVLSGLFELCDAAVDGRLHEISAPEQVADAHCVVMVSEEYPASNDRDAVIHGLDDATKSADVAIFHASAAECDGELTTNKGGRVLSVVGRATEGGLKAAAVRTYRAVHQVTFDGLDFRTDIGPGA